MTIREYRHVAIAINRKFICEQQAEPDDGEDEEDDVHDEMVAYSTKVAISHYCCMISDR